MIASTVARYSLRAVILAVALFLAIGAARHLSIESIGDLLRLIFIALGLTVALSYCWRRGDVALARLFAKSSRDGLVD